jgi:hypothetical protein
MFHGLWGLNRCGDEWWSRDVSEGTRREDCAVIAANLYVYTSLLGGVA